MRDVSISLLLAATLQLGVLATVEPVRADEAYVCENGRIVYVRFGQLEVMKRENPCVAAYYGQTVEPATQQPASSADPTQQLRASQTAHEAAPIGPAGVVLIAGGSARAKSEPVLKSGPRLVSKPGRPVSAQVATSPRSGTVGRIVERAPPPLPTAHPDTDFRNIRLINAQPGQSEVFHHQR